MNGCCNTVYHLSFFTPGDEPTKAAQKVNSVKKQPKQKGDWDNNYFVYIIKGGPSKNGVNLLILRYMKTANWIQPTYVKF